MSNKKSKPSITQMAGSFVSAQVGAIGKTLRDQDQINQLQVICQGCPSYVAKTPETGFCIECACSVSSKRNRLNKLALPNMECPIGKWGKEDGGSEDG